MFRRANVTVTWVVIAGLGLGMGVGCGKKAPGAARGDAATSGVGQNPLLAPVDYLGAQAQAKRTAGRVVSLAELQNAIQKFQAMEDRFPRDLNELVTERYLPSVPVAPPGMKFRYDPATGSIAVGR